MLSPVPAAFFSSPESILGNPFPSWDCSDSFPAAHDPKSLKPIVSGSGSDPNPSPTCVVDERKRRRMISNRESARRSRMRKQRHLENLRNQVYRLNIENQELRNKLRLVSYQCDIVGRENNQLQSEYSMLRQKMSSIDQILMFRQLQKLSPVWPCNNVTTTSSLMTI